MSVFSERVRGRIRRGEGNMDTSDSIDIIALSNSELVPPYNTLHPLKNVLRSVLWAQVTKVPEILYTYMYPGSSPALSGARMLFKIFWLPAALKFGLNHSEVSGRKSWGSKPLQIIWAPCPSMPGTHIVSQLLWMPAIPDLDCAKARIGVGGRPWICGTMTLCFVGDGIGIRC